MSVLSKSLAQSEPNEAAERRGTIRHQITVSADVVEIKSNTKFSTRTTDLGPGGCFVDTLMPLPVGSAVRIRLQKDNVTFDALGTVTFSQTGLGMGIAFDKMPPEKLAALDAWLIQLTSSRPAPNDAHAAPASTPTKAAAANETRATRKQTDTTYKLIRLLVKRGVISERDAETLLGEPLL
ncbi:MAG TPA: PilZ domain-containing protein [Candidatus Acidoferrales bacterium]|nr:PilZ domain-containing protein [Candidatus Acidoferrales bacterium]